MSSVVSSRSAMGRILSASCLGVVRRDDRAPHVTIAPVLIGGNAVGHDAIRPELHAPPLVNDVFGMLEEPPQLVPSRLVAAAGRIWIAGLDVYQDGLAARRLKNAVERAAGAGGAGI